jgi:hypothetical protein
MDNGPTQDSPDAVVKMGMVPHAYPPKHARYLLERNGVVFTATPCYGMHDPWWVAKTLTGEAEPEPMQNGDRWRSF